ncbi:hypothetical protein HSB1_18540 [Halogranum salarium B-1]|uniref:Uncharacterized protein n=1 Tax=Halogranum salarium B-1 TaxID=1210908 RepID=J3JG15_9EURY|nr:hypothetical protein HSB1_18540 [Halogranum salarium B-1]
MVNCCSFVGHGAQVTTGRGFELARSSATAAFEAETDCGIGDS